MMFDYTPDIRILEKKKVFILHGAGRNLVGGVMLTSHDQLCDCLIILLLPVLGLLTNYSWLLILNCMTKKKM